MNLTSQQLSRAAYIIVTDEQQVTVTCNWCTTRVTETMDHFDLPNMDWVAAIASHVHEKHKDVLADPKYWEYLDPPVS